MIVDTSVWVDFFNGAQTPHGQALTDLIDERAPVMLTDLILTEVLQGIRQEREFKLIRDRLFALPVIQPADLETFIEAARFHRRCRAAGRRIRSTIDCVIAAVAIENNLPVFHRDRDFDVIAEHCTLRIYRL